MKKNYLKIMAFILFSMCLLIKVDARSIRILPLNNEEPASVDEGELGDETLSGNTNLTDIKIDNVIITGFSSDKKQYTNITVTKEKINITATVEDSKSTISGTGEKTLTEGNNTIEISVTAENGSIGIYTLVIKYESKSKDNNLKTLEIFNKEERIELKFDTKTVIYNVDVVSTVESITIKSTLNDTKASYVKNYGNRDVNLEYGKNKIEIRVKAENGDIKAYTLNINREDNRSSDTTLSKLVINGVEVALLVNTYEYSVDLRYKQERSIIEATPTNSNSVVDLEQIDLVYGENIAKVKVTAENGDFKEYKLIINRLTEEVSKVVLENIVIENYPFEFNKDTKEYNLNVDKDVKSLNITVNPSKDIIVKVLGNENLRDDSTIIVRITDDDGEKNYTFNIHKDSDKVLGFIPINVLCYIVFGIGVLSFGFSIIYAIKKNKD